MKFSSMIALNRHNPLLWLGLLLLAWLVLGVQLAAPKPASGPFYAATEHHLRVTRWEASPRLGLDAWTTKSASGDTIGAKDSVDAPTGRFGPTYRPADSDQFEKILTSYYGADKTGSRAGNGGLADAVRYEKATGDMLPPAGHEQKAIEVKNRLSDRVRNADNQSSGKYPCSQRDIDFAKQLIKDIDNALVR